MLELFFVECGLKIAHLMAMINISMLPTLEKVSSYSLLSQFIYISPGRVQKRYFEPFFISIHVIHVITNLGIG